MRTTFPGERFAKRFEVAAVIAVGLLLVLAIVIAIVILYVLFINGIRTNLATIDTVDAVQEAVQRVFAGVLLVLLGLELIETLRFYFVEHRIRIEMVLIVAMIAVGRHIVQVDLEHTDAAALLGVAALMIALAASYFLVKGTHREAVPPGERKP